MIVSKIEVDSSQKISKEPEEKIIQFNKEVEKQENFSPASPLMAILNTPSLKKLLFSQNTIDNVNRFSGQLSMPFEVSERIATNVISDQMQLNSKGKPNQIKLSYHELGNYLKVFGEIYEKDLRTLNDWFIAQKAYSSESATLKSLFMINKLFIKELFLFDEEAKKLNKYADYIAREFVKAFPEDGVNLEETWLEVLQAYTEKEREYHNLKHIYDLLTKLHDYQNDYTYSHTSLSTPDANLVRLAIIFHDFVYVVGSTTNEEDSVVKCSELLKKCKISDRNLEEINKLIMSTKLFTNKKIEDLSESEKLISDIDLSGFSLPWLKFLAQNKLIASEFMPDGVTISGIEKQIKFLEKLSSQTIYKTALYIDCYEHIAQANIKKEIVRLKNQIQGIIEDEKRKQEESKE